MPTNRTQSSTGRTTSNAVDTTVTGLNDPVEAERQKRHLAALALNPWDEGGYNNIFGAKAGDIAGQGAAAQHELGQQSAAWNTTPGFLGAKESVLQGTYGGALQNAYANARTSANSLGLNAASALLPFMGTTSTSLSDKTVDSSNNQNENTSGLGTWLPTIGAAALGALSNWRAARPANVYTGSIPGGRIPRPGEPPVTTGPGGSIVGPYNTGPRFSTLADPNTFSDSSLEDFTPVPHPRPPGRSPIPFPTPVPIPVPRTPGVSIPGVFGGPSNVQNPVNTINVGSASHGALPSLLSQFGITLPPGVSDSITGDTAGNLSNFLTGYGAAGALYGPDLFTNAGLPAGEAGLANALLKTFVGPFMTGSRATSEGGPTFINQFNPANQFNPYNVNAGGGTSGSPTIPSFLPPSPAGPPPAGPPPINSSPGDRGSINIGPPIGNAPGPTSPSDSSTAWFVGANTLPNGHIFNYTPGGNVSIQSPNGTTLLQGPYDPATGRIAGPGNTWFDPRTLTGTYVPGGQIEGSGLMTFYGTPGDQGTLMYNGKQYIPIADGKYIENQGGGIYDTDSKLVGGPLADNAPGTWKYNVSAGSFDNGTGVHQDPNTGKYFKVDASGQTIVMDIDRSGAIPTFVDGQGNVYDIFDGHALNANERALATTGQTNHLSGGGPPGQAPESSIPWPTAPGQTYRPPPEPPRMIGPPVPGLIRRQALQPSQTNALLAATRSNNVSNGLTLSNPLLNNANGVVTRTFPGPYGGTFDVLQSGPAFIPSTQPTNAPTGYRAVYGPNGFVGWMQGNGTPLLSGLPPTGAI